MKTFLTLLLALLAGVPPAVAQVHTKISGQPTAPAAVPGTDPCARVLVASPATICQGGSAVLTMQMGCIDTGPFTYSWTPDQDISALSGYRVVVNPLVTTTYNVNVTTGTGQTYSFSATINVQANCCQQASAAGVIELNPSYQLYNSNQPNQPLNDPFRLYPPGTTFHVAGPSLTLLGNAGGEYFLPPTGSVLLMDADARIILGTDAKLETNGLTITAACNAMWDGLYVQATSRLLDMHSVPLNLNTNPDSRQGMHNRILHSKNGIVLEAGGPEFQINYTQFLHNYNSLDVDRTNMVSGSRPPVVNKINTCVFDADPAQMKAPYAANGSNVFYTNRHLRLAGNPALNSPAFLRNSTFNNALFHVVADRSTTPLRPYSCTFSNFLLAGIFYGNATNTPPPPVTTTDALTLRFTPGVAPQNAFNFRPYKALPATSQISNALALYAPFYGTAAVRARDIQVAVLGVDFTQEAPGDYAPSGLSVYIQPQVGIQASKLDVTGATFQNLTYGIVHDLPAAGSAGGTQSVTQSYFGGCGTGYLFTALRGSTNGSNAGTAQISCNTFARVTPLSVNTGVYNGIGVEANAFAKIGPAGAILPNLFDRGDSRGASRMRPIANANTSVQLGYNTYTNIASDLRPYCTGVTLTSTPAAIYTPTQPGSVCAPSGPNGLQRAANPSVSTAVSTDATPRLGPPVPNPTQVAATVSYSIPTTIQAAALVLRRALDGRVVQTLVLDAAAKQTNLDLKDLPAGLYFYTLLVDDVPIATRRLVVE